MVISLGVTTLQITGYLEFENRTEQPFPLRYRSLPFSFKIAQFILKAGIEIIGHKGFPKKREILYQELHNGAGIHYIESEFNVHMKTSEL